MPESDKIEYSDQELKDFVLRISYAGALIYKRNLESQQGLRQVSIKEGFLLDEEAARKFFIGVHLICGYPRTDTDELLKYPGFVPGDKVDLVREAGMLFQQNIHIYAGERPEITKDTGFPQGLTKKLETQRDNITRRVLFKTEPESQRR